VVAVEEEAMIEMLVGALILLIGIVIGRRWGRAGSKVTKAIDPEPICGCEHHYSNHDKDGHCHASVKRADGWDRWGDSNHYEWVPCICHRYTGPEPLPTYTAKIGP